MPVRSPFGEGAIYTILLKPEIGLLYAHFSSGKIPWRSRLQSSSKIVQLFFILNGSASEVRIQGESAGYQVSADDTLLVANDAPLENDLPAYTAVHYVCLFLHVSVLESVFRPGPSSINQQKMTPQLRLAVRQLVSTALQGNLRLFYLEAKTLEIAALRLSLLRPDYLFPSAREIKPRDAERLCSARCILEAHPADPPTIVDLARQVGLNPTKLKGGFQSMWHTTVYGLVRDRRMEMARSALEAGHSSVSEIACDVGYNSLSHFCSAFKRRYGVSPGHYRSAPEGHPIVEENTRSFLGQAKE